MKGGIKEVMVVGFAAKGSAESDGKWGYVDVEESLVWAVGGATGPERGWAEIQELAVEGFGGV